MRVHLKIWPLEWALVPFAYRSAKLWQGWFLCLELRVERF